MNDIKFVMTLNVRDAGMVVAALETTHAMLEKSINQMEKEGATELAVLSSKDKNRIKHIVDEMHRNKSYTSEDFTLSMDILDDIKDVERALQLVKAHKERKDALRAEGKDIEDTAPTNIVTFDPSKRDK